MIDFSLTSLPSRRRVVTRRRIVYIRAKCADGKPSVGESWRGGTLRPPRAPLGNAGVLFVVGGGNTAMRTPAPPS